MSQQSLDQAVRVNFIIWGALIMSVVIYSVIGTIIVPEAAVDVPLETMRWVFIATGVGTTGALFVIRNAFGGRIRVRTPQSWATRNILSWALSESVAIFGLILRFLGDSTTFLYGFAAWSVLLMLRYRPTREGLEDWVKDRT